MNRVTRIAISFSILYAFTMSQLHGQDGVILDVPNVKQLMTNWCWAASYEMVNSYFNGTTVVKCTRQCEQATRIGEALPGGLPPGASCCDLSIALSTPNCNSIAGSPEFVACGYTKVDNIATGGFLSWPQIKGEIEGSSRPFLFSIAYGSGYNHMLVARGFCEADTIRLIYTNDPAIGKTIAYTYPAYKNGPDYDHGYDIYEITPSWTGFLTSTSSLVIPDFFLPVGFADKAIDVQTINDTWLQVITHSGNKEAIRDPLSIHREFYFGVHIPYGLISAAEDGTFPKGRELSDIVENALVYYSPLLTTDSAISNIVTHKRNEAPDTQWELEYIGGSAYDKIILPKLSDKYHKKLESDLIKIDSSLISLIEAPQLTYSFAGDVLNSVQKLSDAKHEDFSEAVSPTPLVFTYSPVTPKKLGYIYFPEFEASFLLYCSWFKWCVVSADNYPEFQLNAGQELSYKKLIKILQIN